MSSSHLDSGRKNRDRGLDRSRALGYPNLRRDPDNGIAGGLCAAIAQRRGLDPLLVRSFAVIAAASAGAGCGLYLALWSMTPTVDSDQVPLDRIFPGWRRWNQVMVAAYICLLTLVFVVIIGRFTPLTLWPGLIVVVATIAMKRYGHLISPETATTATGFSAGGTVRRYRWSMVLVTLVTLLVAAGCGFAAAYKSGQSPLARLVIGTAVALAVVGLSLLLSSRWGAPPGLRTVGVILSALALGFDLPYLVTAHDQTTDQDYRYTTVAALPDDPLVLNDVDTMVDLRQLADDESGELRVNVTDGIVTLRIPDDRVVTVEYECVAAQIELLDQDGCTSIGVDQWSNGTGDEELTIWIHATRAQVEVTR